MALAACPSVRAGEVQRAPGCKEPRHTLPREHAGERASARGLREGRKEPLVFLEEALQKLGQERGQKGFRARDTAVV